MELERRPEGHEGVEVAAAATAVTAEGPPEAAAAARTSSPMKRALEDQESERRGAGEGCACFGWEVTETRMSYRNGEAAET